MYMYTHVCIGPEEHQRTMCFGLPSGILRQEGLLGTVVRPIPQGSQGPKQGAFEVSTVGIVIMVLGVYLTFEHFYLDSSWTESKLISHLPRGSSTCGVPIKALKTAYCCQQPT